MDADLPHRVDAFGLHFACGFPCPGTQQANAAVKVDVRVREAPTPADLGAGATQGFMFEARPDRLLLKTRVTADFLVADGERIDVSPKPGADPIALGNLLFGWVTGGLLLQRGLLTLHGAAVATPNGAVVFCGDNGVGKSTLVSLLMAMGLPVLDDNIVALAMEERAILAQPGLGSIRLMRDTLDLLGWPIDASWPLSPIKSKFLVDVPAAQRCLAPLALRRIYFLQRCAHPECTPVSVAWRPRLLQAHTFMARFAAGLERMPVLFRHWLRVAAEVPMFQLGVPADRSPVQFAEDVAAALR